VEFKRLEVHNFLSYEHTVFNFTGAGLTLIEGANLDTGGSNGAGKSSGIVDGLAWCLFDRTMRGVKGDAVINRKFGEDCFVVAEFDRNADKYKILRTRNHSRYGTRLAVFKNGDKFEGGTKEITQQYLLDELGIDFDLFKCTVVYAQGDRFNFVDETDKEQKSILSKVRRLDFSLALRNARDSLKMNESSRIDIERKVAVLKSHLVENPGDEFKDLSSSWKANQEIKLDEAIEELTDVNANTERLRAKLIDVSKYKDLVTRINEAIANTEAAIKTIHKRRDNIVMNCGHDARLIKNYQLLQKTCATCGQDVDREFVVRQLTELNDSLRLSESILAEIEKYILISNKKLEVLKEKRRKVNTILEVQDEAIRLMKESVKNSDRAKAKISAIRKENNPYVSMIAQAIEKQRKLEIEIIKLGKEMIEVEKRIPYLRFWDEAFGDRGIKSYVFDSMCSTLNNRANHYLNILTDGTVSIKFDTQSETKKGDTREKFECSVISDGTVIQYAAYSGGEKTRISLAVDMALADLMNDYYGSKFNILIHDEQDTYLDREGRQNYMRLLKERSLSQHVFVVCHDQEFKASFDDVWRIEKKDGLSRLVG
jgi:DNA repair exonuclease SbcCD ATPase subunit